MSDEIDFFVLATSYSRLTTTIASTRLNCCVRKENRCDPSDESPEQTNQFQRALLLVDTEERHRKSYVGTIVKHATPTIPFESSVDQLVHLGSRHYCPFT